MNNLSATLSSLTPSTLWGWIGAILLIGAVVYHRTLTTMGMVLALGVGFYLYFVLDSSSTTSSS